MNPADSLIDKLEAILAETRKYNANDFTIQQLALDALKLIRQHQQAPSQEAVLEALKIGRSYVNNTHQILISAGASPENTLVKPELDKIDSAIAAMSQPVMGGPIPLNKNAAMTTRYQNMGEKKIPAIVRNGNDEIAGIAYMKPVTVSLEKCVAILKLSRKEYETNEEMVKAVLEAAGVAHGD